MSSWACAVDKNHRRKWTAAIGLKQCACKADVAIRKSNLLKVRGRTSAQAEENSETVAPGLEPIQRTPSPLHPTKSTARRSISCLGFFSSLYSIPLFNAFPFGARHKTAASDSLHTTTEEIFVHEIDAAGRNFREMRRGTGIYRPAIFLNFASDFHSRPRTIGDMRSGPKGASSWN